MIGDALMDSLGGALGGSTGAGTLPPPRAKVSRGGGAPSAGGFGAELVALLTGPAQPDPLTAALVEAEVHLLPPSLADDAGLVSQPVQPSPVRWASCCAACRARISVSLFAPAMTVAACSRPG